MQRDQLVLEHLDVARRIARKIGRRVPAGVAEDDLVGAAMIGLAEAADRYDASRGQPFIAFAEKRIRGAILDELRCGDPMSRRARIRRRGVDQAAAALAGKLGRAPRDEELAAALGIELDALAALTPPTTTSIDEAAEVRDADAGPADAAIRHELTGRLAVALRALPERDAMILQLYYVEELSYAEIGRLLGVTESRICQLHSRSLTRLRAQLVTEDAA